MDSRRNMLIGIVIGVVIVGVSAYATGLTKPLLSSFHSSVEYRSSESANAPDLAGGDWINSERGPLRSCWISKDEFDGCMWVKVTMTRPND